MSRSFSRSVGRTAGASAALLMATLGISACSTSTELSADSTCSEYIERSTEERHDAAFRISTEVDGVPNAGNPMWGLSLDGACGSDPDLTLGEYFERAAG